MNDVTPEVGEITKDRLEADDTAKFVNQLLKQWRPDVLKQHKAIKEARKFKAGKQWKDEDASKLKAEDRPMPEINLAKKYLEVISGMEIINRNQVHALARVPDNAQSLQKSELMTGAYRFVMETSRGDFEHSVAFSNLLCDGLACVGQRLDMTLDMGGEIRVEDVDVLEMAWDTVSHTQNLENGRGMVRFRVTPKWVAINEWPDEKDYIEGVSHDGQQSFPIDEVDEVKHTSPFRYNPANEDRPGHKTPKDYVTVKEAFWYEDERYHQFIDPFSQKVTEHSEDDFKKFQSDFKEVYPDTEVESVRRRRRVYKRAFIIRNKTMEVGKSPMQTGFPYKFITGDWDFDEKVFRGLLFTLMEPQRFSTKFLAQTMQIMAVSGKVTTFYEDGAFENITQAQEEIADYNPFIKVEEGAISGQKFKTDPPPQIPDAFFTMWQALMNLLQTVTGINLDVLGQSTGEVPGVTSKRRLSQGLASVAMFFNAYRRFLLVEAPGVIEYIQKFYTDDRLIRLGGQYDGQVVQLVRDDLMVPWDLKIDDQPESAEWKSEQWESLQPIVVQLFKTGAIFAVPSIMQAAPLNAKQHFEIEQWLKMGAQAQQQSQGKDKDKKEKTGQDPALIQANVQKRMAEIELIKTRARALDQESSLKALQAQSEAYLQHQEGQRANQQHRLGMFRQGSELRRAHEAHQMDQLSQLSKTLDMMNGSGMPQAQI
jgi:hypothetical protein